MSGKRFKTEEIVPHLWKAEVMRSQGVNVADVIRKIGVNKITSHRWRREFDGLKANQARREIAVHHDGQTLGNRLLRTLQWETAGRAPEW